MRQSIRKFDAFWSVNMKKLPHWLNKPMEGITFFGEPLVILPVLAILAFFAINNDDRLLLKILVIGLIGIAINSFGKWIFARRRPDSLYVKKMWLHTFSFPSGHAGGSVITYGICAIMAWHLFGPSIGVPLVIAAALISFLIGLSRVYLEAHFMSDVIAGWTIGLITLAIIVIRLQPF
jgi:undecaprenyl-diphosphatase